MGLYDDEHDKVRMDPPLSFSFPPSLQLVEVFLSKI